MDIEVQKAAKVLAPQCPDPTDTTGTVTNSGVIRQTLSTTAGAIQIPDSWLGSIVRVKIYACNAFVFFRSSSSGAPSGASLPDATKTSADPQLGWKLGSGEREDYRLPERASQKSTEHMYLCYDADAAGELWAYPSSEPR
jgi:hypothetical protein